MLTRSRAQSKRKESSFTEISNPTQESPLLVPFQSTSISISLQNVAPGSDDSRSLIPPILAFAIPLAFGAYYAGNGEADLGEYVIAGCCGILGLSLFLAMAFIPDGPFIRPFRILWRIILGIGLFYICILVPFLFIPLETAREALRVVVDGRLGVPLPSRSYAEACELVSWNVILDQLDVFVALHIFGWVFKALIYRDISFCWILSIAFEFLEYALQHQLPNFAECWWDHWILDVLLCNAAGIVIGLVLGRLFAIKPFSWARSSASFDRKPTSLAMKSFKNYLQVLFLLAASLVAELTCFYIKHLLWLPVVHPLNAFRLLLITFLALGAVREFYDFLIDDSCKVSSSTTNHKTRPFAAVTLIILVFESLICIRWGRGQFPIPAPFLVKICAIATAFILLVIVPVWLFIIFPAITDRHKKKAK